jgi:two-component system, chemotaxis family, sensor kinase CheA
MTAPDAGSPERDPETVALFVEESLEGLHRIERFLLQAERGSPSPDLISTLFREIHTIKGTSGFLNLVKVQSLSHVMEDFLARLRDGTLVAQAAHYSSLVEASDRLRRLIETVRATGDEGRERVDDVIARLAASAESVTSDTHDTSDKPHGGSGGDDGGAGARGDSGDGTIRVNLGLLDNLMNLMGELVLARNQIVQLLRVSAADSGRPARRRCSD